MQPVHALSCCCLLPLMTQSQMSMAGLKGKQHTEPSRTKYSLAAAQVCMLLTPCCLAPALIRCIHKERMSRFFCRRSRYAYCKAFSTLSLAIRKQLLLLPRKPFASLKTLSLCILFLFTPFCCYCHAVMLCLVVAERRSPRLRITNAYLVVWCCMSSSSWLGP